MGIRRGRMDSRGYKRISVFCEGRVPLLLLCVFLENNPEF